MVPAGRRSAVTGPSRPGRRRRNARRVSQGAVEPVNESHPHDGLTPSERQLLNEYNAIWDALGRLPKGSAEREQLERRLATLESQLGL